MLVYGDLERHELPREKLRGLEARLASLACVGAGVERHAALVAARIEAGELVQGLADREMEAAGRDRAGPAERAAMALCLDIARAVGRSWRAGLTGTFEPSGKGLKRLAELCGEEPVRVRRAEGHAFYALYPEAYFEAALTLAPRPDTRVIGVRSIGAGLSAMVAAGLGARAPLTVRPVGHPYCRELRLCTGLRSRLLAPASAWAVVDEGPGLSGSSFGAVVGALDSASAAPIVVFPGHAGDPGAKATPDLRTRWAGLDRRVVELDRLVPTAWLASWAEDLIGRAEGPVEDLSAGAWRRRAYAGEAAWPAVFAGQERRKFLVRTASGPWLLKFAGLGGAGEAKLERARRLEAAGFGPATAGLRHGFLIQRWIAPCTPLERGRDHPAGLARTLGRYLGFRARRLEPGLGSGASPEELLHMARTNACEALGARVSRSFQALERRLRQIAASLRPVEVDSRLHPWEWLLTPSGRLIKADALDHAWAHDLVGRQDAAWDLAGAIAEFDLDADQQAKMLQVFAAEAGYPAAPGALGLMSVCYPAFQLGRCTMAIDATGGDDAAEASRLELEARRYARKLEQALDAFG